MINSSISECEPKCGTRNSEPEIGTDGSSHTRHNPRVDGYLSRFGPPWVSGSGFWTGLDPNRPISVVQSLNAGGLPRPVANTRCRWYWKQYWDILIKGKVGSKFVLRNQDKTNVQVVSKLSVGLLYNWTSKDRRIRKSSNSKQSLLFARFVCHPRTISFPQMYHPHCSPWSYTPPMQLLSIQLHHIVQHRNTSDHICIIIFNRTTILACPNVSAFP